MNSYLVQIEKCDHNKIKEYGIIEHEFKYLDRLIHFKSDLSLEEIEKLDCVIRVEPDTVGTFY